MILMVSLASRCVTEFLNAQYMHSNLLMLFWKRTSWICFELSLKFSSTATLDDMNRFADELDVLLREPQATPAVVSSLIESYCSLFISLLSRDRHVRFLAFHFSQIAFGFCSSTLFWTDQKIHSNSAMGCKFPLILLLNSQSGHHGTILRVHLCNKCICDVPSRCFFRRLGNAVFLIIFPQGGISYCVSRIFVSLTRPELCAAYHVEIFGACCNGGIDTQRVCVREWLCIVLTPASVRFEYSLCSL